MKILVCEPIEEEVLGLLRQSFEVELEGELKNTDADIIIVRSKTKVTKEIIESAENLKIIGRPGVGIDNIDIKLAKKKGIKIINTPEALTESVAELTVGLMFSLARKIPKVHINLRSGKWLKRELKGIELSEKTLGILGLGNIGRRVIEICDAIGMNIIYWSRNRKPDLESALGITYVDFNSLFKLSDFLSIHIMLTPQTRGIVGKREIALMKQTAFLINTSRGAVLDEEALYDALTNLTIAGAGLDVYVKEPYCGRLRKLDNVILTPHIGSNTQEAQLRAGIILTHKIFSEFTMLAESDI